MLNNNTNRRLEEILKQIHEGEVALFLGAGASHSAGGPLGGKLTKIIKEKFPYSDQSLDGFIEVCQDVIETPPYDRNMLEDFIKSKLNLLQPTQAHNILTQYNWAAIFTTNFDDIVELAYRTNKERLKPCQAICSESPQVTPADRSRTYLFKIMGSVTAAEEETGCMVLSRADYNSALIRRRKYLDLLFDFVKCGTIVFIGYSFGDRLVLDIIDDMIERYGKDRLPWSYALFDQLDLSEKARHKFSSRKIIPLEYNFEKFFSHLKKNCKVTTEKLTSKKTILKIRGYSLEIEESDARQYAEHFDILNEEKIKQEPGDKDKFFMGTNKSWGCFKKNWDFKRDLNLPPKLKQTSGGKVFSSSFNDRVFDELKKHDIKGNKVLLLTGMAGVGKTMALKRLAYDVYRSGEAPVIIINYARTSFDYKLLSTFIENLNYQLNQRLSKGEHSHPIKPVIIIDDAASLIRHVNRLKDYLTSRGRTALIIAAERVGEWNAAWKEFPFNIPKQNSYILDEQLTENEKKNIIDHFYDLGYIPTKGIWWDDIITKNYKNSYFATIYSLVHPSKKPLDDIIRDQFQNLRDLSQKAYQFICCFHQFDLPINLELLVRSLKCSYENFYSDVIEKDTAKVIFEEEDETGNILFLTHHRIIAEKTIDFFFSDPEIQKGIFLELLKEATLTNRKEREICEKLLVQHLGPNSNPQILSYEQQRQLFKTICEKNESRTLVHHWGLLEANDHKHLKAQHLLKRALEIPRGDIESYRGESDQHILTSLGNLYSHIGIDCLKKGKIKEAEEYFENAEASFQVGKHGEFPNAHAYHCHANMWCARGYQIQDDIEQIDYFARSLEILSIAKDNLNEGELHLIYELETRIWSQIGDELKISKSIETLRNSFDSARGYYLNAEFNWRKAQEKEGEERKQLSGVALIKVEEGLEFFPRDEHCLQLRSKLLKELEPHNLEEYYNSLQKWKAAATTQNAWLLFELGRTCFILTYYDYSRKFFEELQTGVGMGHKLRSRPRHPIHDEKGNKKEFEGAIVNIFNSKEGNIRCENLRSLKYTIPFRPIACSFTPSTGDSVKFFIEFSYRGPRAETVKKI